MSKAPTILAGGKLTVESRDWVSVEWNRPDQPEMISSGNKCICGAYRYFLRENINSHFWYHRDANSRQWESGMLSWVAWWHWTWLNYSIVREYSSVHTRSTEHLVYYRLFGRFWTKATPTYLVRISSTQGYSSPYANVLRYAWIAHTGGYWVQQKVSQTHTSSQIEACHLYQAISTHD